MDLIKKLFDYFDFEQEHERKNMIEIDLGNEVAIVDAIATCDIVAEIGGSCCGQYEQIYDVQNKRIEILNVEYFEKE